MPHVPDLHLHDTHDRELIAAHAAGDLEGRALATAADLLATCSDCAELHADLRAIATATARVPARPRTRDFRLTPADAARLRPGGWRRLVAAFSAPRLAFTAPLGGGLAALGLAAILVAAAPGAVPFLADGAGMRTTVSGPEFNAGGSDNGGPELPPVDVAAPGNAGGEPGKGATDQERERLEALAAQAEAERVRRADEILFLLGGGAVVVGLGLAGLRWSSRRFA